jgi:hypothetical protein
MDLLRQNKSCRSPSTLAGAFSVLADIAKHRRCTMSEITNGVTRLAAQFMLAIYLHVLVGGLVMLPAAPASYCTLLPASEPKTGPGFRPLESPRGCATVHNHHRLTDWAIF